jgi:hypothetical protein
VAEMVLQSVRGRSLFLRFFAESVFTFLGREKKIKKIGGKFIRWTPYCWGSCVAVWRF